MAAHIRIRAHRVPSVTIFKNWIGAIRDDLKMEKTYNVIFHLIVVGTPSNANKVK